jgi:hypothetical protein
MTDVTLPTCPLEAEDGGRGRGVFVWGKGLVLRARGVARHLLHLSVHQHQQRVHGMTAGAEQARPAAVLLHVPRELPAPRPDAVVVVHLTVVQLAEQALLCSQGGLQMSTMSIVLSASRRLKSS